MRRTLRASKAKEEGAVYTLLHYVDIEMLRWRSSGFSETLLRVFDGLAWREYEQDLDDWLTDLHGRLHRGAYRALPSWRKFIRRRNGNGRWVSPH